MQFANHAFPLEMIVDSIDTTLNVVHDSLHCVGITLGAIGIRPNPNQSPFSLEDSIEYKRFLKLNIPDEVVRQLKEAGFNPEFLTEGELHEAACSYAADGNVIDDPDDTTLMGKLKLHAHEEQPDRDSAGFVAQLLARRRKKASEPSKPNAPSSEQDAPHLTFQSRLDESREAAHSLAFCDPSH